MPRKSRLPARPRELNQLAAHIGAIATHEIEDEAPTVDPTATKRGLARAAKLTPKRRKQIAKKAAAKRWGKGGRERH